MTAQYLPRHEDVDEKNVHQKTVDYPT